MSNLRRSRDIVSIKRTIWSNYDKFRTLGAFYLEKNQVLDKITLMTDEEISAIAAECRDGGVRWRNFVKHMNKIESALLQGREIVDLSQSEEKAIDTVGGMPVSELITVKEKASGVAVSFNLKGRFDILQKGNRNGCFELKNVSISPDTEFTLVNELTAFWEDRYSVALKGENLSVAIASEDPKTGKKGSACVRIYVIEGDKVRIDDLGKYIDTSAMTLWINP